ncbi:oxygen-independent coproporphyrinogen III oxidase [Pseudomonas fluorescens WH6]|nr:oxygen-independent coproporphyrinogen III oxidase [Pseudomonas fluorescens WH6]
MHTVIPRARAGHAQGVLDLNGHADRRRFHAGVGSLDVLRALRASRQCQRPLALTLHWPASPPSDMYRRSLAQEIQLVGCHLGRRQPLDYLQWRGAAPIDAVQALMTALRERFNFLEHGRGDYGIDLDPRHTDWAAVGLLRELGFNRVCIGVPDARAEDAQADFRNPAPIQSLIDAARTFDFRSVSVDLGYGSAWQTLASFELKLASLIALEPDRLHVFDYAQPPSRYLAQPLQTLGAEADKTAMRQMAFEHLDAAGYHYIGLGQFARGDDDLTQAQERGRLSRTCEGFSLHGYCDHIGLGLGAFSQIDTLCAQNTSAERPYAQALNNGQLATCQGWQRETGDALRDHVVERLACDLELDIQAIERRYGLIFSRYFAAIWPVLEQWDREGLIELSAQFLCVLPAGRRQVDELCAVFAALHGI